MYTYVESMPHCKFARSWLGLSADTMKTSLCSSSNAANFVKGSCEEDTCFVLEEDVAFEALLEKRVHQDYDKDGSMQRPLYRLRISHRYSWYSWEFWNVLRDHGEILHVDSWLGIKKAASSLDPHQFSLVELWEIVDTPRLHIPGVAPPFPASFLWPELALSCDFVFA